MTSTRTAFQISTKNGIDPDFTWRERNSMPQYFKWNLELIQGLIANPDANIPRVDNDIYNTVQKFDGLYADSFMATRRFISILHNEVDDIYRYGEFALQNAYAPFPTDPWADPQEVPEEYYEAFKGVGISTSVSNVLRKFYRYFIKAPPLHPEGIDLAKSFLADATMSREELSYLVKVITQALLNYDNGWNAQFFSELPTKQEECFSDMLAQGNAPFNSGMCIEYDLDENIDPGRCRCMVTWALGRWFTGVGGCARMSSMGGIGHGRSET